MSGILSAMSFDGEAVVILSDGAVYNRDGVLLDIRRKVLASERLPLAVAFRGNLALSELAAQRIIDRAEEVGFDRMLSGIEAELTGVTDRDIEVLIAGVSETAGPMHRVFQTRPAEYGLAPNTMIDAGNIYFGFGTNGEPITLEAMGIPPPRKGETMETWLSRQGVSIFEHFRQIPVAIDPFDENSDRQHFIGGILDMTVVTRRSVSISLLHHWPDKVGERINPFRHDMRQVA